MKKTREREAPPLVRQWAPRFLAATVYGGFLVLAGTVGYIAVEGWDLADSLYMSVITLTAVGYAEVRPLTQEGRYLTMVVLGFGVTWLGIWFALITSFIVELDLRNFLRKRRIMKEIHSLSDHLILCGAGRTGRRVIEELMPGSQSFVLIEKNAVHVEKAQELVGEELLVINADATQDSALVTAGIEKATGLISALGRDEDNVYVCLSARALNPGLRIVVRAYDDESINKLYRAGADNVVSPNVTGAVRMASVMLRPSVVSFLDVATRSPDIALRVEQSTVTDASELNGKTLQDARIREETGLIVIAIRKKDRPGTDFMFNPGADTRLEGGDELIVLGQPEQIDLLKEYASG